MKASKFDHEMMLHCRLVLKYLPHYISPCIKLETVVAVYNKLVITLIIILLLLRSVTFLFVSNQSSVPDLKFLLVHCKEVRDL